MAPDSSERDGPATLRFIQAAVARDILFSEAAQLHSARMGRQRRTLRHVLHRAHELDRRHARPRQVECKANAGARGEITVPHACVVHNAADAEYAAANLAGWPAVVKPSTGCPTKRTTA